jgi:DNA integrity scanning protein DisA with diadenylate cyclase activity
MKINTSDKFIAYLTLISGLTISAVAVWYSVAGLVSIFAAAAVPIIIMGVVLELSKLVATVWLKMNWSRAPMLIRTYLIAAIAILMLITSMGIFGFLSKAHLDQNMVSGDVIDKVAIIDEKIKTQRDNIDAARKALIQMDAAVDQTMARSTSEQGADKAANLRRSQQRERTALQKDISTAQAAIAKLNEERAPMAKDLRAIEAEVGPIKYIAAFVYGSNPDANLLEKAVTWVIIIIVVVFDPLAVILLLASQYSFQWIRKDEDDNSESEEFFEKTREVAREFDDDAANDINSKKENDDPSPPGWMFTTHNAESNNVETPANELETDEEDQEILDSAVETEKQAMQAWKHDHPDSSLKIQRRLFERGIIDHLPWEDYLKPKADFADNDAATEALKWAQEQLEERPGDYLSDTDSKKNEIAWMENKDGHQIKKTLDGYQQNAEQSERTIWQRIQDAKK